MSLDCSGLSATIGMPEKFNAWLETVQKAKGFEHKFIHHLHRYSHLRKFAYFPQLLDKDEPFVGLDGGRSSNEMMRFIHPVSTLSFAGTMPPDLSLESSDLLHLYRVLLSQKIAGVERAEGGSRGSGSCPQRDTQVAAQCPTEFFRVIIWPYPPTIGDAGI